VEISVYIDNHSIVIKAAWSVPEVNSMKASLVYLLSYQASWWPTHRLRTTLLCSTIM